MKFTVYGNCQADALAKVLRQSPGFAATFGLAGLAPCFSIKEPALQAWAQDQAAEVGLIITQKLRKGWRKAEVFDTDWLESHLPESATRLHWSDMYYKGYAPQVAYPLSFPRRPPSDYINILHLLTFAHGRPFTDLFPFYTDPGIFPVALVEAIHKEALDSLAAREEGCDIRIAPYIARHWREERLFETFNHPRRPVLRHAAQQVLDRLGLADPVPETGPAPFRKGSGNPLLAAFDAVLERHDTVDPLAEFSLTGQTVRAEVHFARWEAEFETLGRARIARELAAQMEKAPATRMWLPVAAEKLGIAL